MKVHTKFFKKKSVEYLAYDELLRRLVHPSAGQLISKNVLEKLCLV